LKYTKPKISFSWGDAPNCKIRTKKNKNCKIRTAKTESGMQYQVIHEMRKNRER
jgi:hypothetical protein